MFRLFCVSFCMWPDFAACRYFYAFCKKMSKERFRLRAEFCRLVIWSVFVTDKTVPLERQAAPCGYAYGSWLCRYVFWLINLRAWPEMQTRQNQYSRCCCRLLSCSCHGEWTDAHLAARHSGREPKTGLSNARIELSEKGMGWWLSTHQEA